MGTCCWRTLGSSLQGKFEMRDLALGFEAIDLAGDSVTTFALEGALNGAVFSASGAFDPTDWKRASEAEVALSGLLLPELSV